MRKSLEIIIRIRITCVHSFALCNLAREILIKNNRPHLKYNMCIHICIPLSPALSLSLTYVMSTKIALKAQQRLAENLLNISVGK